MKFPNKLSKERYSLLSVDDKKIYDYEHSGLCPEANLILEKKNKVIYNDKGEYVPVKCKKCGGKIGTYIKGEPVYLCTVCGKYYGTMPFHLNHKNEADEYDFTEDDINEITLPSEYTEQELNEIKRMLDEMLFESQFDELFDKELINEVGLDEYNNIKKNIFEYILNDPDLHVLNEAEGRAADWWMDCSWIVKLSAGLLTGLLGVIAWLYMKGKDRLAMMKLKQYMNKLVELTDQGVNKKRPWYSFLMGTKKAKLNTGDYNKACFRTIQETAERNMACLYTQCIHNLGFLSPSLNNFNGITSGYMPDEDSGLGTFYNIANNSIEEVDNSYIFGTNNMFLPVKLNNEYFQNLKLPALPTNYSMLMSNIDYPTKANQNPNGSLFMKPTLEILQAKGSDIGQAYFNDNVTLNNVIIYQKEGKNEYVSYNDIYKSLLLEVENEEGIDKTKDNVEIQNPFTGDLDATKGFGKELEQETKARETINVSPYKGNMIDAIDNYVRASVPIVSKLVRSICGKNSSQELKELIKVINNLNSAAEGNLTKYLRKTETVLAKIMDNEYLRSANEFKLQAMMMRQIVNVTKWLMYPEFNKLTNLSDEKKRNEFVNKLLKKSGDSSFDDKDFKFIINTYTNKDSYNDLRKIADSLKLNIVDDSYNNYTFPHIFLFEDEQVKNDDEIIEELLKQVNSVYYGVKNQITEKISMIIENDPADWYIVTNSRERMKKLKEACDKEITEKINLICRTSQQNSGLSDKFKAALSKHPVRAQSLTNIWSRYSDDLEDRIESRIRSISGDNGNSNILDTIKQFLTVTYPNLIAIMLYYKQAFFLIKLYTEKHPLSKLLQTANNELLINYYNDRLHAILNDFLGPDSKN